MTTINKSLSAALFPQTSVGRRKTDDSNLFYMHLQANLKNDHSLSLQGATHVIFVSDIVVFM